MKFPNLVECASVPCWLPEDVAREVDEVVKGLPKDSAYAYRRKSVAEFKGIEPSERTDVSYITVQSVDSVGDFVSLDGVDTANYDKHKTVFFEHDRERIAGKNLWLKADGRGILAKTYYPARPEKFDGEWLPERIWGLVSCDPPLLVGKSVGFLPLEIEEPDAELRKSGCQMVIKKSLLMEYSCVSVPANPDTIIQSIQKNLDLELLGIRLGKPVGMTKKKTKKIVPIDRTAEFLAAIDAYQPDPDKLAEAVLNAMKNRGRV